MAPRPILVWGIHAARATLERAAESILEMWLKDGALGAELEALAEHAAARGIRPQIVSPKTLARMTEGAVHQGIVLRRRLPVPPTLDGLIEQLAERRRAPLLLILDRVQDPHNLGACLRVADGAGVDALIVSRDHCAPVTGVVAKAASGALDAVDIVPVPNLARAITRLRAAGIWVFGLSHDAASTVHEADMRVPLALVCGTESTGMRRLTRENCDALLSIPMRGTVGSLNVSTAAAIALFEAARQRADET